MPEIFVSYRRADAAGTAGRLFDRLSQHFGAHQIFRDIDSIELGDNFEQAIRDALRTAATVLIVIGPRWLELRGDDGARRIDDADDYVRREIEFALGSEAVVIPVLVDGAVLPNAQSLPNAIQELTKRNAFELSHRRWENDIEDLIRHLENRGIRSLEPHASGKQSAQQPAYAILVAGFTEFIPNLFALLRQPRHFLARRTQGNPADLTRAFIFFVLTAVLAVFILVSAYTPIQSVVEFGLAVLTLGLVATIALSALLWMAWRLVGATGHYSRLLVVLLYQVAVLHLVVLVIMWIIVLGLDLRSLNVMRETLDEAMKTGGSVSAALEVFGDKLEPLVDATEVRIALGLSALVLLAGVGWTVRSWGAYRDAFGLSRAHSIAASFAWIFMVWAVLTLIA